jgi:hypothetical protein
MACRRTKKEVESLRDLIVAVVSVNAPMTVRQVFYQLVSLGVIGKAEADYRSVVVRLLTRMRLDGEMPWNWITDGTRWMHKSVRYGSIEEALEATSRHYRRDYWRELDDYVEVWLEKEALAGVLFRVTDEWGVPLMVTRGFASLSYIHNAAETIERIGKPTHIYCFGDYDPSGVEIDRNLERRLREFAPSSEIQFERVAVRREQIEEYSLPTRPTKRRANHGRGLHEGDSVEVDAIPPAQLLDLVRGVIEQHVDPCASPCSKRLKLPSASCSAVSPRCSAGEADDDGDDRGRAQSGEQRPEQHAGPRADGSTGRVVAAVHHVHRTPGRAVEVGDTAAAGVAAAELAQVASALALHARGAHAAQRRSNPDLVSRTCGSDL